MGDKYGTVATILPATKAARDTAGLTADEMAQLVIDVWTLPQPHLRPGEDVNLLKLLAGLGQERYGRLFARTAAVKLLA